MANTVIQLKHSTVQGNVPVSLANGEISINTRDGKLFYADPTGTIQEFSGFAGPAGLNGEIQFNDSGVLGANAGLTFDKTTGDLSVTGNVTTTSGYFIGDGSKLTGLAPALQIYNLANTASGVSDYMVLKSLAAYSVGTQNTTTKTVTTTPTLLTSFITDVGFPNITSIPSGDIVVEFDTQKASGAIGYYCYAEIYKRTVGGTETLIATTGNSSTSTLNSLIQQRVNALVSTPIVLDVSDRIVLKIYAVLLSTSASISIFFDGAADGALTLPVLPASTLNFVPYINATANVYLNSHSLITQTVSANSIVVLGRDLNAYANAAFLQANTPSHVANSAGVYANGAFAAANNAANTNLTQNNSITAAFAQANAAYTRANNSLNANTGGTVTGTIIATSFVTTGTYGDIQGANAIYANTFIANTGGYFQFADGSKQYTANAGTGGGGGGTITVATDPPASGNANGDIWIDSNTGNEFTWFSDGDSYQWVELGPIGEKGDKGDTGDVSGPFNQANAAFIVANASFIQANAAFDAANNATDTYVRAHANSAFHQANAAYAQANTNASNITVIQGVNLTQNTNISNIEGVNLTQNTNITAAQNKADNAFHQANASYGQANTNASDIAVIQGVNLTQNTNISNIEGVNLTQNTNITNAQNSATAAFIRANNSLNANVGGVITGPVTVAANLTVTGNLTIIGNTVTTDIQTLNIGDPLIYLAANNYTGDAIEIGFAANYYDGSTQRHTGVFREASNKEYYVFDNYTPEPDANLIDINDVSFRVATLNANLKSQLITLSGQNLQTYVDGAYNTANAAFNSANLINGVNLTQNTSISNIEGVNDRQNNRITYAENHANAAFIAANNATDTYVRNHANAAFDHANAAYDKANTGGGGLTITIDTFTGTGSCTQFTLSVTPTSENYTIVSFDGAVQHKSTYSLANSIITFSEAPANATEIDVVSFVTLGTGTFLAYNEQFAGTGACTTFTLANTPNDENYTVVSIDGAVQHKSTYSLSGASIVFSEAPPNTSEIDVTYFKSSTLLDSSLTVYAANHANAAFIAANNATDTYVRNHANSAFHQANAAFTTANAAFTSANGIIAWNTANAAFIAANAAIATDTTQNNSITAAFNQANTANNTAVAAFNQANSKNLVVVGRSTNTYIPIVAGKITIEGRSANTLITIIS